MLLGLIYYHYPEKSTFLCVYWCHRKKKKKNCNCLATAAGQRMSFIKNELESPYISCLISFSRSLLAKKERTATLKLKMYSRN